MPDACREMVVQWFTNLWGRSWNANIVSDLGAPDLLLRGWVQEMRGRAAVVTFMTWLREAFPNLHFRIVGVIAVDGDRIACRWDGGGTHLGAALRHHRLGVMPTARAVQCLLRGRRFFAFAMVSLPRS